jgi:hypothetical protein
MSHEDRDQKVPAALIERPEFIAACAARDMQAVFTLARRYGLSVAGMGRATRLGSGRVRDVVDGTRRLAGFTVFEDVADGLGIPGVMLGLADRPWEQTEQGEPGPATMVERADLAEDDEVTVQRRQFLLTGAGTAAGCLTSLVTDEPLAMKRMLSAGKASPARIGHFESAAEHLGTEVIRVASPNLLETSLIAFKDARKLAMECTREADRTRIIRANAMLANVVGLILFDSNHFDASREWYLTARNAASEVGDQFLADIALCGQAYEPTYSNDPEGVLSLLMPRLDTRAPGTAATAWQWAFCGKAYAALGDRDRAEHAFDQSEGALGQSPEETLRVGIYSFLPEKLDMYRAQAYVSLGQSDRAIVASQQALSTYDPRETTEPSLARFELASALLQTGEVEEACKYATEAVAGPNVFLGISVRKRAVRFRSEIPDPKNSAAREWNDALWAASA